MNKQQQQEFLSRPCESNTQWVAQVLLQLEPKERHTIVHALRRLDKYLYKSWAKDMTLNEIMEAVNIFSEVKPAAKEQLINTMEPNAKQPDELKATEANEQATEQQNAQESASLDTAMGATQDSEEGSTEG